MPPPRTRLPRGRGFRAALGLLLAYAVMGAAAPLLAPHDPVWEIALAQDAVPPGWYPLLVGDTRTNPPITISLTHQASVTPPTSLARQADRLELQTEGPTLLVKPFQYPYRPPPSLSITLYIQGASEKGSSIAIRWVAPHGQYLLWEEELPPSFNRRLYIDSRDQALARRLGLSPLEGAAETLMASPGTYQVQLLISGRAEVSLAGEVRIHPAAYGILGTDHYGRDVWSQFLWGARYSLAYALLVAGAAGLTGFLIGLISGYRGGPSDTLLTSLADIVQALPIIPLAFGVLLVAARNDPTLIAFLATAILWAPIARQVRARTLQEKSKAYVEAARAIGLTDWGVIRRHILPNLSPLLTYHLILLIPTAITIEATLDILGFASETTPTWGWIIYQAWIGGALRTGAWWWMAPPIIGIITLTAALLQMALSIEARMGVGLP